MTVEQWFHDEEFDTPLPEVLSTAVAKCYGTGPLGVDFAQGLAAFMDIDYGLDALRMATMSVGQLAGPTNDYLARLNELGYDHVEIEILFDRHVSVFVWRSFNRTDGRAFGADTLAGALVKAVLWAAATSKSVKRGGI